MKILLTRLAFIAAVLAGTAAGYVAGAGGTIVWLAALGTVAVAGVVLVMREFNTSESARHAVERLSTRVANGEFRQPPEFSHTGRFAEPLTELYRGVKNIDRNLKAAKAEAAQAQQDHGELERFSFSLANNTQEAEAHLNLLTTTVGGMIAQVNQTSENAQHAMRLAQDARNKAHNGDRLMAQMVVSMKESDDAARSISRIIRVIDEIAFQTNLLALNAAVEAARAGRHGKGFAVVAEEVRNLAARSGTAAKETSELIERSLSKVENATTLATETAGSLSGIVEANTQFSDLVAEIAAAAEEEAGSISTINDTLSQLEGSLSSTRAAAGQLSVGAGGGYSPADLETDIGDDFISGMDDFGMGSGMDDFGSGGADSSGMLNFDDGDEEFGRY